MSGDTLNNDDDFLDDPSNEEDFVIEDIVGKNDDLEDLFEAPVAPDQAGGDGAGEGSAPEGAEAEGPQADSASDSAPGGAPNSASASGEATAAEEDLLFSDHTEGITPSEEFAKPQFAESGATDWQGDNLDLESVGVPASSMEDEEQLADPQIDEAKESFAAELDSLLEDEQDFGLDAEEELELVDRATEVDDGISEFEQSGPFVIDDGDGLWSEDDEQEAGDGQEAAHADVADAFELAEPAAAQADTESVEEAAPAAEQPTEVLGMAEHLAAAGLAGGLDGVEGTEEFELGTTLSHDGLTTGEASEEPGWEPLPSQSVDELSEVDEVQRASEEDDEEAGEYFDAAVYGESGDDAVEGYGEEGEEGYEDEGYEDEGYDESGYEDDEVYESEPGDVAAVPAGASWSNKPQDLDEVDGHDLYAEESDGSRRDFVVGAVAANRRGLGSVLLSLAATLLIVLGVGAVVVRPEWFGLRVDPERVAKVEIARPQVELAVHEPPVVVAAMPAGEGDAGPGAAGQAQAGSPESGSPQVGNPSAGDGGTGAVGDGKAGAAAEPGAVVGPKAPATNNPEGGNPATGNPATGNPATGNPATGNPTTDTPATGVQPTTDVPPENGGVASGAGDQPAENTPAEAPPIKVPSASVPGISDPTDPKPEAGAPAVAAQVGEPGKVVPPGGNPGDQAWPVASTTPDAPVPAKDKDEDLTRFGDGLLVGDLTAKKGQAGTINGVMPGSRAFAQLHNGNYFIGQVKQVAETTITLRVEAGEVTLATIDIAQLTPLGSADYDQLQKATKGFVRLTNNNRLVGGILSRIADDHVVLEFRSNRVMLPKSAIGEIVSDDQDRSNVRLDTTTEEDSWLREMVGRKLGTGQGNVEAPPQPPAAISGGAAPLGSGGGQLRR